VTPACFSALSSRHYSDSENSQTMRNLTCLLISQEIFPKSHISLIAGHHGYGGFDEVVREFSGLNE